MKNYSGILVCSILILSFQVNLFAQTNENEAGLDSDRKIKSKHFAVDEGTFTDSRDGKTYKTIQIGKQTWMAENMNYKSKTGSWIYGNEPKSAQTYGRLYDWQSAPSASPDGWRLPGDSDWDQLID
jgi:photosystem II stability/assembly factor-like uncharacterized protein